MRTVLGGTWYARLTNLLLRRFPWHRGEPAAKPSGGSTVFNSPGPAGRHARLRTPAAHARWDEFGLGDVVPVIELTRRTDRGASGLGGRPPLFPQTVAGPLTPRLLKLEGTSSTWPFSSSRSSVGKPLSSIPSMTSALPLSSEACASFCCCVPKKRGAFAREGPSR